MIKLVPAKCPSCDANIEVNEKLEKTICQYCGTTVLIDEAISKHKVELSGKVKVVNDYSNKIETAKKFMKLKKYKEATYEIGEVLLKDKLNVEAKLIFIQLMDIKVEEIDLDSEDGLSSVDLDYFLSEIMAELKEVTILDEDDGNFKEEIDKFNKKYTELNKKHREIKKRKNELIEKCNKYCDFKVKNVVKLLRAFGFSDKKYGGWYGINTNLSCHEGVRNYSVSFCPEIKSINSKSIYITHNYSKAKGVSGCTSSTTYDFTKEDGLTIDEYSKIVDSLLDGTYVDDRSIISKIFGILGK